MMAEGDDLRSQMRALEQRLQSYQNVLIGGFDLNLSRLDDMERIRLVRNGLGFAIDMFLRRDEINRKLDKVGELLDMRDPTHLAMLDAWVKLFRMEDPALSEILAFARKQMKVDGEKSKVIMAWVRMVASILLGAIVTYVLTRITGK